MAENLTEGQVDFVIGCVERWMNIMQANGQHDLNPSDPSHSNLLPRLLSGTEPLPYRPPTTMSRPDPWLAVQGGEVSAYFRKPHMPEGFPAIVINGDGDWGLVSGDEKDAVVVWPPSGIRYRLTALPDPGEEHRWHTHRLTPPPAPEPEQGE